MIISTIIRIVIAAAAILLLDQFGFWVWLVAHPFWNFKGALIGIAIGTGISLVCWLVFRNRPIGNAISLGLPIIAVLISYGITSYGKSGFAESFGEDRTAGVYWYFGYLALTTFSFVTVFAFTKLFFARKPQKTIEPDQN